MAYLHGETSHRQCLLVRTLQLVFQQVAPHLQVEQMLGRWMPAATRNTCTTQSDLRLSTYMYQYVSCAKCVMAKK